MQKLLSALFPPKLTYPQDPPILILGKNPIAVAIAATLKLHSNNCQQSPHIPTSLNHQSLILSITSPTNAIAQIHHLRSKHQWEGTFIAIVRTPTEHQQLHNLSIFGEPDGSFPFGKTNGQTILTSTSPHLLTDILTIHQRASTLRLRTSAWQGLLAKSSLYPLLQQISQIDRAGTPANSATPATIHQILTTIHSLNIDWDSIISHENARYIRYLKSQYPQGNHPSATELPDILTNLQTKLANITG